MVCAIQVASMRPRCRSGIAQHWATLPPCVYRHRLAPMFEDDSRHGTIGRTGTIGVACTTGMGVAPRTTGPFPMIRTSRLVLGQGNRTGECR